MTPWLPLGPPAGLYVQKLEVEEPGLCQAHRRPQTHPHHNPQKHRVPHLAWQKGRQRGPYLEGPDLGRASWSAGWDLNVAMEDVVGRRRAGGSE